MNRLSFRFFCRIYGLLVLLLVSVLAAPPYSLLALAWLLVLLFSSLRPIRPGYSVVISVVTLFLVPLVLEPLLSYLTSTTGLSPAIVPIAAAMSILPIIYLLDYDLRQKAQNMTAFISGRPEGRYITTTTRTLLFSALVLLLVSLALNNLILLFTDATFILYLLIILIWALLAIPRLPLYASGIRKGVIAGNTVDVVLQVTNQAPAKLKGLLSSIESWVKVTPQRFDLIGNKLGLNLTITPPLAGPLNPGLQVSVIDPRGFVQVNQQFKPLELQVIPRARYAEWLARKCLTGAGIGATVSGIMLPKTMPTPRGDSEYFESRDYQPGDELKNVDWKHTLKLRELIVKEYIDPGEQPAIIAANLSVTDAEEADKLALNLITAALTLVQEAIPGALAAYDHRGIVLITPVIDPGEILKRALLLMKDITSIEATRRFLQPTDIGKLRQNIIQLKQAPSEPAQRLLNMLNFEYRAIEKAAKNHPASLTLSLATKQSAAPATIILLSQLNHDVEALTVTADWLSRRGFTTVVHGNFC